MDFGPPRKKLKYENIFYMDENGNTALHKAFMDEDEDEELISELVKFGNGFVNLQNKQGKTALNLHIRGHCKISIVEMLLDGGANVNSTDESGKTLLHIAAAENNEALAKLVIDRGINVNAQTKDGRTALHQLRYSHLGIAKLILENGGDVQLKTDCGATVLHGIYSTNSSDLLELYLQYGVDINAQTVWGKTILQQIITMGDLKGFELLLKHNVDLNAVDNEGNHSLHHAIECKDVNLAVKLILKESDIHLKNKRGDSPLHSAVLKSLMRVVEMLLDSGVDINDKTSTGGQTALHLAASIGSQPITRLLLRRKANIEVTDLDGLTPLHFGVRAMYVGVVRLLINAGSNVNARTNTNKTPLHFAVHLKEQKIPELLLQKGCQIDARNNKGETALHTCAIKGEVNCLMTLVRFGAQVHTRCENYLSPIHAAMLSRKEKICKFLLSPCCKPDLEECLLLLKLAAHQGFLKFVDALLHCESVAAALSAEDKKKLMGILLSHDFRTFDQAVKVGLFEVVKLFTSNGYDVNTTTSYRTTLLENAVDSGSKEVVECLLNYGSNLDCKTNSTLLIKSLRFAMQKNNFTIPKILLRYGASANVANKNGETPLFFVVRKGMEMEPIMRLLFIYGCNMYVKNKRDETPLFVAHKFSSRDNILVKYEVIFVAAGKYNKKHCTLMQSSYRDLFEKCCCEIKVAKSEVISIKFTVWDVLWKRIDYVASYMKNEEVLSFIESEQFIKKYEIYGNLITHKFKECKLRREKIDECIEVLNKSDVFSPLPEAITRYILSYLLMVHLQKILLAYGVPQDTK